MIEPQTVGGGAIEEEVARVALKLAVAPLNLKREVVYMIQNSKTREHKVELSRVLSGVFGEKWEPHYEENAKLWVYFPVKEHLRQALEGEDYLVLWQPPMDDHRVKTVYAYDSNGKLHAFDAWGEPPDIPVLVLTYEEPPKAKGGQASGVFCVGMYINDRPEPWFLMPLEIYAKTKPINLQRPWQRHDFPGVNWPYRWYYFGCYSERICSYGSTGGYITQVWEDDGWGDPDDFIESFSYYPSFSCGNPTYASKAKAKIKVWRSR